MTNPEELPEWQPVVDLHGKLSADIIRRAERATRTVGFALPADKVFDLRLIYPDDVEQILENDPTIVALGNQVLEHAYQADERAERIRTRRTIVILSLLSLHEDSADPSDRSPLAV